MSTILFSGRFDRPNTGHIITLGRLGRVFDHVIVPVLNYEEQRYDVNYRVQLLKEAASLLRGNYTVVSNDEHFAEITQEELSAHKWVFDLYGSGNHKCLVHMASLGYKTLYVERAYDFASTDDRNIQAIKEVLNG